MNGIGALAYLDFSRLRNTVRAVFKQPSRLLIWLFFAGYIALLGWQRISLHHNRAIFPDLRDPYATVAAGIVIAVIGLTLGSTAATGRISGFQDPADAFYFARSAVSERIVFLWLVLRSIFVNAWQLIFALVFVIIYYAHGSFAGAALGLIGVALFLQVSAVPVWIAARKAPWISRVWYVLAAAGVLVAGGALLPAGWPGAAVVSERLVALGLGTIVLAIWHGQPLALAGTYACIGAAIACGALMARDIYPELYASSRYVAERRARVRRSPFGWVSNVATRQVATRSGDTFLRGPWVEIWKQLAFLRRGNGRTIAAATVGAGCAIGLIAGFAERRDSGLGIAIASPVLLLVFIYLTMSGVSLAKDLSKPLWWIGDGALWTKLLAWTIGSSIPAMLFLATFAIAGGALGAPSAIPILLAAALLLPLIVRCIAVLVYAVFPSQTDQRGPAAAVRMLAMYLSFLPAVAAAVLAGIFLRSAALGFVAAFVVFAAEGACALALAAWRIGGRGAEIALAESG